MEQNIILAGVGGQGILSIAYVIDRAAAQLGLAFKQAEVHGMSQRGGAVQSHLRISDQTIHSDLVPLGRGTLVLAVEPLESLRYVEYLAPEGAVVASVDPFVNIKGYPELEQVLDAVAGLPRAVLVPAEKLARQAGSAKAQNIVLLGAAAPFLGLPIETLEACILATFERKGEAVQQTNIAAFRAGLAAGQAYQACRAAGIPARATRALISRLDRGVLEPDAVPLWKQALTGPRAEEILARFPKDGQLAGSADLPRALVAGDLTRLG